MKHSLAAILPLVFSAMCIQAHAQIAKIKDGDRLTTAVTGYIAKGSEAVLDSDQVRTMTSSFTEKDGVYTTKSDAGGSTVIRKTHVVIARENAQGAKTEIAPEQQHNWLPPSGDFSKPWTTSIAISNPNCGKGKVMHEASAKPIKYTVQLAGNPVELAAFEIQFNGKWDFNNHCRSGKQIERFVFSPELDFIVERDFQLYDARGFLLRGTNFKVKAVN